MACFTDPVPPLWPTPSSDSSTPALDDAKLQFATEEVRKRFSAISMTDMLAVLSMLLAHPRSRQCAGTKTDGTTKDPIHKAPPESGQTQTSARSCVGRNSTSCHQHPSSVNSSITASETSLGGWNTMDSEMDGVPLLNTPTASRLSQEWTTTLTSILDNARQYRQSADEHLTVVDVVRLSIKEWFDDVSVDAEESEKTFAASASAVLEPPGWIATLAQVRRLAEEACHTKYKALYERLCSEAEDEGDEGMATPAYVLREDDSPMAPSVVARRSSHRVATESFGIPPFSLVIQCGRGGSGTEGTVSSVNIDLDARNDGTHCNGLESNSASFVVGCEWFQWVFLARSSLACQSEPYPVVEDGLTGADAEAAAAGQQKWRQRHCIVQLLYPSEAGFSDGSDGSSDLRSAEAQYELSDPHVVLSSLLGVAMRVWCRNHPHNVAQVFRLEEDTCPQHLYDGSLFWSAWPFRDAATLHQCESAATSRSMPIPLLPGECFSHDVDLRGDGG
ncbi:hypothetical protein JKF63_01207 [Porcisia hertigi]|uniref:Uncharacterized protein n=1 Tax=Porcisia hertigi TaxID=2761500 RepID=A0A836IDZ8_9TRYP|nr:hypothetical protein JKF63_01207 [Porcisia hertigi]